MAKKKTTISSISSALAAYLLRKICDEGGTIKIPSLDIEIKKEDKTAKDSKEDE